MVVKLKMVMWSSNLTGGNFLHHCCARADDGIEAWVGYGNEIGGQISPGRDASWSNGFLDSHVWSRGCSRGDCENVMKIRTAYDLLNEILIRER